MELSAPNGSDRYSGVSDSNSVLQFGAGEYITSMEAHWGMKNGLTRVFYLKFGTNAGNSVAGKTQTDSTGSVAAPDGYQLAGFYGRDGGDIDLLGAVWATIPTIEVGPGTVAPTTALDTSASTVHESVLQNDRHFHETATKHTNVDKLFSLATSINTSLKLHGLLFNALMLKS